ncbi:acyltransferase family protein [Ornithinimicrobium sp. W1665]
MAPHWAALDGLRGLAVVAVLIFHALPTVSPNGFAGVDIFFVLSGFLITSLLLRERATTGRVSLRHFYMRRILRLDPALIMAAMGVLLLAWLDGELREALPGVASALVYMSHVTIALGVDSGLLSHTWTLSLEEHYYLYWPVVLLGLLRGGWWRWVAIAGLVALALMVIPGLLPGTLSGMYWRGLTMMIGSVVGVLLHWRRTLVKGDRWGALGSWGLLLLAVVVLAPIHLPTALSRGPLGLPALLSVVVILGFVGTPDSMGARALSLPVFTWVGKRAYGLYLYHFPIILSPLVPGTFERLGVDAPLVVDLIVALGLTILVAWGSYRWVEVPFLRMKGRFRGGIAEAETPTRAAS